MLSLPVQKRSKDKSGFFFLIFPSKDVFKSQFIALSDHIE